jgi:hypothetical protein
MEASSRTVAARWTAAPMEVLMEARRAMEARAEERTEDEVDAGVSPEDIDRQEAERLLDAMKQNEKNLQLWRFQQKKKQRKPNEKDW